MIDYHLLFMGDILFVSLLTIIYLSYSCFKKIKTDKTIKYILLFVFCFYWIFFVLSTIFTMYEVKGIAGMSAIPLFIIYYLLVPINKSNNTKRILKGILTAYVLLWIALIIGHSFSNM